MERMAAYHYLIELWADSDMGNNITIGSLSELANDTPMPGSGSTSKRQSIKLDKIGPRGGRGGGVRDVQVPPYRLLRLEIHSKYTINGISFSYIGSDGSVHHESWGGGGKYVPYTGRDGIVFEEYPIQLGLTDYVKEISGTTGAYTDHPNIVRSLKVVTFKRTYGPYGATDGAGSPFSFPVQGSARITGFFGRSGDYLDSIGVYIREC
ncbi:unnamed protein product [Miscanthus lutarioriparius]|uniref:Jacalin-type lectin domain-containing protein n=1 Tax=Miscanthus lutarioriparius TaxID=422564 RepID=A0A811S2W1_9POAL|nr:unnamed protein product [Miscanthus lutarioriparius]